MKFGKVEETEDYDTSNKKTFFSHLFNFEGEGKADVLNVLQYSLISLIPLVALNKLVQYIIPEASDEKGSLEISLEIIAQIVLIFLGLIFIDRFSTYFKTYSGVEYPKHSVLFFSLGILLVVLSLQSKLGEKVSILSDRFMELFGKEESSADKKKKAKGKSQGGNNYLVNPQSQTKYAPDVQMISLPTPPRTNQGTTSIDNLPNAMSQSLENSFTQMPSSMDLGGGMGEPMAANSLLGGSFGSSW
jgi:hypothetical protein